MFFIAFHFIFGYIFLFFASASFASFISTSHLSLLVLSIPCVMLSFFQGFQLGENFDCHFYFSFSLYGGPQKQVCVGNCKFEFLPRQGLFQVVCAHLGGWTGDQIFFTIVNHLWNAIVSSVYVFVSTKMFGSSAICPRACSKVILKHYRRLLWYTKSRKQLSEPCHELNRFR